MLNRINMKKAAVMVLFFAALFNINAQDIQISQYYAVPLFLNPAMTGLGNDTRVGVDYRNQWARIGKAYSSEIVYGDHYFKGQNISVGAAAMNQVEGYGKLKTTELSGLGAYTINLGEEFAVNAGLQASYAFRGIDYNRLDFGDQYTEDGLQNIGTSETFGKGRSSYFDVGAGLLIYGKRMFLGASMHHLPRPDITLNTVGDRLERKLSIQGGFKIPLQQATLKFTPTTEQAIMGIFNYKKQGLYSQFDIGSYLIYEPVMLGLWYRGLPVGNKIEATESIVALAGIKIEDFTFAYSYDIALNKLGGNGLAVHEISFTYEFVMFQRGRLQMKKRPDHRKDLPCAKFLK